MKGIANEGGRPRLVYATTERQKRAIRDYFFTKIEVKSLRDLAPILECSVQGASNISLRVLADWAHTGEVSLSSPHSK